MERMGRDFRYTAREGDWTRSTERAFRPLRAQLRAERRRERLIWCAWYGASKVKWVDVKTYAGAAVSRRFALSSAS